VVMLLTGRWVVRILAGTLAILTEIFRGFPQSHCANSGVVPQLGNTSLQIIPNPSFVTHLSI
jgi:hypothetical protein